MCIRLCTNEINYRMHGAAIKMEQCNFYRTVLLISMFGCVLNVLLIYTFESASVCKLEY